MKKTECDICHQRGRLAKLVFLCRKVKTTLYVCTVCGHRLTKWFKRGVDNRGEVEVLIKTVERFTLPPKPIFGAKAIMVIIASMLVIAGATYWLLR